jgi:hypothetical protein
MFDHLFLHPAALRRHREGPLAHERATYLTGLAARGSAVWTLRRLAALPGHCTDDRGEPTGSLIHDDRARRPDQRVERWPCSPSTRLGATPVPTPSAVPHYRDGVPHIIGAMDAATHDVTSLHV